MLILAFFILIFLAGLGYYFSKDVFAPYVIAPLAWIAILLLYFSSTSYTFPIIHHFPVCLVLWNVLFCISSFCTECYTSKASQWMQQAQPSKKILNIYLLIIFLTIPVMSFILIKQALTEDPENFLLYLRMLNTGLDESIQPPNFGILTYFLNLPLVCLILVLLTSRNKLLIWTVILVNIIAAFVSMSKLSFLGVFFTILFVLYRKNKIGIKHFIIGAGLFLIFSFTLQILRAGSSAGSNASDTTGFLGMYLLSSMGAFDWNAMPFSATHFGENTLRFFYAIGHPLHLCEEPISTILPFTGTPEYTNTYTLFYPFYTDFGLYGIVIFAILYGIFYGFIYKKSLNKGIVGTTIYTIFVNYLMLAFFAELILYNLSMQIQYLFFILLPFIYFTKKKHANS